MQKSVVRQADSAQKLRPLRDILSDSGVLFIHRAGRGYERDHAARSDFIERLCEKVIVDKEVVFIVSLIHELVITKRHVAYCKVKKAVGQVCLFKTFYCNVVLLIKLLRDAPGKRVKFHAVHLAVRHTVGDKSKKFPMPQAGSSTFPIRKPMRSTAE